MSRLRPEVSVSAASDAAAAEATRGLVAGGGVVAGVRLGGGSWLEASGDGLLLNLLSAHVAHWCESESARARA